MSSISESTSAEFSNAAVDEHDQSDSIPIKTPFPHRVRGDGVVVMPDKPPTRTVGGIELPESQEDKPLSGIVLGFGPGKRLGDGSLEAPDFAVGAHVVYRNYAGTKLQIKHDGREIILLPLDEVRIVLAK